MHSFFFVVVVVELVGWFSHQGKQILGFNIHSYSLLILIFVNQSFKESGRTTRQIRCDGVSRLEMTLFSTSLSPNNPVHTKSCAGLGPCFKGNPLNIA